MPGLTERVDSELRAFLDAGRALVAPAAHGLLDELSATIAAGGKRLRPAFCYWGHRAAGGGDPPAIFRAAAALELLHTFAIVHDDVMDRSPVRRGRPSAWRSLASGDERFGTSAAVLAGDLALVLADRLLRTSGFSGEGLERAADRFDRMRVTAVAGQLMDLEAARRGTVDEAGALEIASLKSGGYTVSDPLAIGALLAGAADPVLEPLARYGEPLGRAFQLRDDLLGVFGDPVRTGKDRDSDLLEGKQTYLLAAGRRRAGASGAAILARAGTPDVDADAVRTVLSDSGALDETLRLIDDLAAHALGALETASFPADATSELRRLAGLVTHRDA